MHVYEEQNAGDNSIGVYNLNVYIKLIIAVHLFHFYNKNDKLRIVIVIQNDN